MRRYSLLVIALLFVQWSTPTKSAMGLIQPPTPASVPDYQWTLPACQAEAAQWASAILPCEPGARTQEHPVCLLDVRLGTSGLETDDESVFGTQSNEPGEPGPVRVRVTLNSSRQLVTSGSWGNLSNGGHVATVAMSTHYTSPPASFPQYPYIDGLILAPEFCRDGRYCTTEQTSPKIPKPAFMSLTMVTRTAGGVAPEFDPWDHSTPREVYTAIRCIDSGCGIGFGTSPWAGLWLALPGLLLVVRRWPVLVILLALPLAAHAGPPRVKVYPMSEGGSNGRESVDTGALISADRIAHIADALATSRARSSHAGGAAASGDYMEVVPWQTLGQGERIPGGCRVPPFTVILDNTTPSELPTLIDPETCELMVGDIPPEPEPFVQSADGGTAQGVVLGCHRYISGSMFTSLLNPLQPAIVTSDYIPKNEWSDGFYALLKRNRALWVLDRVQNLLDITDDGLPAPLFCGNGQIVGVGSQFQKEVLGWDIDYQDALYDLTGMNNPPGLPGGDCLQYLSAGFIFRGSFALFGVEPGFFHEHTVTCVQHEEGFYLCAYGSTGRNGQGAPEYMNGNAKLLGFVNIPFFTRVTAQLAASHFTVIDVYNGGNETYCPIEWIYPPTAWYE